jgi:hypothetical protein
LTSLLAATRAPGSALAEAGATAKAMSAMTSARTVSDRARAGIVAERPGLR